MSSTAMLPVPPSEHSSHSGGSNDVACKHCRDRKIRCDRHRPKCGNCNRDGAECSYESPGKRVNHIKLLCNSFDGFEDRLETMEAHLQQILQLARQQMGTTPLTRSSSDQSSSDSPVSSDNDTVDEYHGPASLKRLCQLFQESVMMQKLGPTSASGDDRHEEIEGLLDGMSQWAGLDHTVAEQLNSTVGRPSRQKLMKASELFFRQDNCITDVLVQDHFLKQVERVYTSAHPSDEAWMTLFHTIILLVLGAELLGTNNNSVFGFASSLLIPGSGTLLNARLMMVPRLINVQTLILLSVLAQQQESQARSELLFAQACALARMMDLHRPQSVLPGVSPEEHQERWKVCRSLYIRDKALAVSRGSVSWLPDMRITPLSSLASEQKSSHRRRVQLATIQDNVYKLANTSDPLSRSSRKLKKALRVIQTGLQDMAQTHDLFDSWMTDQTCAPLRLDFLATRLAAIHESLCHSQQRIVHTDARVSCMTLLIGCGRSNMGLHQYAEALMLANGSAYHTRLGTDPTDTSRGKQAVQATFTGVVAASSILALLDAFPPTAFFRIVRNILWPDQHTVISDADKDLSLLQQVQACYTEHATLMPAGSFRRKLASVFEALLRLVAIAREQYSAHNNSLSTEPHGPPDVTLSINAPGSSTSVPTAPQPQLDAIFDMTSLSAWPTLNNAQELSWDSWTDFTGSGDVSDLLLLPPQPSNNRFGSLDISLASGTNTDWMYSSPQQGSRKRSRTDQERETSNGEGSSAQRGLDSFMTSPGPFTFSITPTMT
ncbi:hypothetical protein LTR27_011068 [Elasticomyces elasticus]|nr:hypothetical protein LTR27_011068 [Elasticomyces elasticus]